MSGMSEELSILESCCLRPMMRTASGGCKHTVQNVLPTRYEIFTATSDANEMTD